MPTMAPITVKANNGTTDVVYASLTPSAGDTVPAQWRCETASTIAGHRPTLALKAQRTGSGTARRVHDTYVYPVVVSIEGVPTVVDKISFECSGLIPQNVDDAVVAEAVSQYANLRASTLVKDSYKSAFAPT